MQFSPTFTVVGAGDRAVRAIVSGADKIAVYKRVRALAEALESGTIPGLTSLAPDRDSVRVEFDPDATSHSLVMRAVKITESSLPGT
jgi:allophanate hydrolase subunit 1